MSNHTHEVVFDGEVVHSDINKTACEDFARGMRKPLRWKGEPYVGRVVVRRKKSPTRPTIEVDGVEYVRFATTTRGGAVLQETYLASDKSYVQVTIDYSYTAKGHK